MHNQRGVGAGGTVGERRSQGVGRRAGSGLALLVALVGGGVQQAWATSVRVADLQVISAPSPVPHRCAGDSADGESSLAVDPSDPSRLAAAWMQDTSQSVVNASAASRNGGRTWEPVAVPGITRCTTGSTDVTEDPSISLGADGVAYLSSLVAPPGSVANAISTSRDGGYHWRAPLRRDAGDDFPQLVADPTARGRAYVTYSNYTGVCLPGQCVPVTGRVKFSRTVDGGHSFSSPTIVDAPPPETFVLSRLTVLADGSLLDVYGEAPVAAVVTGSGTLAVHAVRSTDKGRTWSSPVSVGTIQLTNVTDPDNGNVLVPHCCPFAVADGPNGLAYVAWVDIGSKSTRLRIARSSDDGRSWRAPLTAATIGAQAFDPAVAAERDGTVGLLWYDFRNDRPGDSRLTADVWFAHSHNRGASFAQTHLAGPFDMRGAPRAGAPAVLGDYHALAAMPHGFGATFAQAKPRAKDGPSDVFFARVRLGRNCRDPDRAKDIKQHGHGDCDPHHGGD